MKLEKLMFVHPASEADDRNSFWVGNKKQNNFIDMDHENVYGLEWSGDGVKYTINSQLIGQHLIPNFGKNIKR